MAYEYGGRMGFGSEHHPLWWWCEHNTVVSHNGIVAATTLYNTPPWYKMYCKCRGKIKRKTLERKRMMKKNSFFCTIGREYYAKCLYSVTYLNSSYSDPVQGMPSDINARVLYIALCYIYNPAIEWSNLSRVFNNCLPRGRVTPSRSSPSQYPIHGDVVKANERRGCTDARESTCGLLMGKKSEGSNICTGQIILYVFLLSLILRLLLHIIFLIIVIIYFTFISLSLSLSIIVDFQAKH